MGCPSVRSGVRPSRWLRRTVREGLLRDDRVLMRRLPRFRHTHTLDPSREHATLELVKGSHSKLRPDEVVPDFWSLDDCAPRAALAIALISCNYERGRGFVRDS